MFVIKEGSYLSSSSLQHFLEVFVDFFLGVRRLFTLLRADTTTKFKTRFIDTDRLNY